MLAMASPMAVQAGHVWVASWIAIAVLVVATFALCGFKLKVVAKLVLGKDNRASTSKFQAVVWTFAICFALLTLFFGHLVYGGFGWETFLHDGLNSDYLWLLGIPATGLVGAKAITQSQLQSNPAAKITKPASVNASADAKKKVSNADKVRTVAGIVGTGVRELVSNDDDENPSPALGDLQYVIFNAIAVLYFLTAFLGHVENGLPTIPATLIALTGVSAGSYLASKATAQTAAPTILSAVPSRIVLGTTTKITVSGAGFMPAGVDGDPALTIAGVNFDLDGEPSDSRLVAHVPDVADATERGVENGTHNLVVVSSAGAPSTTTMQIIVSGRPAPP
jgi:hypothetical protein